MHSTAQSLLPKISSAPAIRDLTSARVRPPRLLWTERLVFPARCCIHEFAAGTGVQTTRLAPRLPACLSSGAPPQQRHRREGNHTQLNGPVRLVPDPHCTLSGYNPATRHFYGDGLRAGWEGRPAEDASTHCRVLSRRLAYGKPARSSHRFNIGLGASQYCGSTETALGG
jgi:hypothetical protein